MNVGASPTLHRRSLRGARTVVSRMSSRLVDFVATILDADPSRLRSEVSAIRPISRWLMVGLLAFIGCSMIGTLIVIVHLTSSSETMAAQSDQAAVRFETASRETYDAIVMRPLFWRSRQPATPPAEPAAAISAPIAGDPQISLKGVLISGDLAKAFMLSAENPAGVWRQRGEDVAGWRVTEIFRDRVVLQSQAERFVVPLSYSNGR